MLVSEPPAGDATPLVLGEKYRLLGRIGVGGMGAVFEAEHVVTGRRLAVKVLLPQFVQNEVLAKRFINEARAAASIRDPHVVEVVDLGRTPDGDLYLVLEFLEGRELKAAIRAEAPFPVERAAHILAQTAALMGRAHALHIVHRDLKPANIFLLSRDGDPDYVKVLDFGIAKLRLPVEEGHDHTHLTRTNDVLGTPLYMAPEQLKGSRDVDARADVYSLGVILYQMLAGRLPFVGESMADIYLKVMTEAPTALHMYRPDLPADLLAVVERAMHREPNERYANGEALAQAVTPWAARWSPSVAFTAPGYTPGAVGPVGGTAPGAQRAAAATAATIKPAPRLGAPLRVGVTVAAITLAGAGLWLSMRPTPPVVRPSREPAVASAVALGASPVAPETRPASPDATFAVPPAPVIAADVGVEAEVQVAPPTPGERQRGTQRLHPTSRPTRSQGDDVHFEQEP